MKILSLDPSLNNLGYAFFEWKKLMGHGVIKSKGDTLPEKLVSLTSRFSLPEFEAVACLDIVVIEMAPKISYGRSSRNGMPLNMKEMAKLHMATGVLIHHFASKGISVRMVDVLEWKGRQKKETTIENVKYFYKLEKVSDHVADAIMIGHWYLSTLNIHSRVTSLPAKNADEVTMSGYGCGSSFKNPSCKK